MKKMFASFASSRPKKMSYAQYRFEYGRNLTTQISLRLKSLETGYAQ